MSIGVLANIYFGMSIDLWGGKSFGVALCESSGRVKEGGLSCEM